MVTRWKSSKNDESSASPAIGGNPLEQSPGRVTLTGVMFFRTVGVFLLGLVFQLAQVSPAAVVSSPCASQEVACACCEDLGSCPCMDDGKQEQKPAPLAPDSTSILKLPAARACDTRVSIETLAGNHPSPTLAASPVAGPSKGYAGVRLSVAFCSFVI